MRQSRHIWIYESISNVWYLSDWTLYIAFDKAKNLVPAIRVTFLVTKVGSLTKPLTLRRSEDVCRTEDKIYAMMPNCIRKIGVNFSKSEDFCPRVTFLPTTLRLCQKISRANSGIFTIETNMYSFKSMNKGNKNWGQMFFKPTFVENKSILWWHRLEIGKAAFVLIKSALKNLVKLKCQFFQLWLGLENGKKTTFTAFCES